MLRSCLPFALLASIAVLPGCDYWRHVEVRNARSVPVDVDASSAFTELDCKTHEKVKRRGSFTARIAPGATMCLEGPLRGGAYTWSEVGDVSVVVKAPEGTCATLDGRGLDAATNAEGAVVVDDARCGRPPRP